MLFSNNNKVHPWLAKRGLVPVTFSSSEVSLFVNCNARDDLPFWKGRIALPLTLWCEGCEVNMWAHTLRKE